MKKRLYDDGGDSKGDDDLSIYSRDVRELLLEEDALNPIEEAFMRGYEDAF